MRRVLLITLHFPPWSASTGHLRVLSFCRELPSLGWDPIVLTAHPRAYAASRTPLEKEATNFARVYRAFALDARVHLSIGGKYASWLALPDRWSSWWVGGVLKGIGVVRQLRPDAILSTYPITTAHLIGRTLSGMFDVPWIADFRDPIVDGRFPDDTLERKARRWVESRTMRYCSAATFTTPGAREEYAERYPEVPDERLFIVSNGYDESIFRDVESSACVTRRSKEAPITLVHSGALYPDLRDPRCLFDALRELATEGRVSASGLRLVFRGSGDEVYYEKMAHEAGVSDMVRFEKGVSYRKALEEILTADGLLLLQGPGANHQIPAKAYEYMRAGRPMLALVDESGDTAKLLRSANIESVAQIDDVGAIKRVLERFLASVETGSWSGPTPEFVAGCSRAAGARMLGGVLDFVV